MLQKIEVPIGAAKLAVGDGFKPDLFLLADDLLDFFVFDGLGLASFRRARHSRARPLTAQRATGCRHGPRGRVAWFFALLVPGRCDGAFSRIVDSEYRPVACYRDMRAQGSQKTL